jgi:hypothetical protein
VAFSQVPVTGIDSDVVEELIGLVCSTGTVLDVLGVLDCAVTDPVGASVPTAGIDPGELKVTGVAAGRLSVDTPHAVAM